MLATKEKKTTIEEVMHKRNVISAAYTYANLDWVTLKYLSNSFRVSDNKIADWLCEAISKNYVADEKICEKIMEKHIWEYENNFALKDSSLRTKYSEAFEKRINKLQAVTA